MPTYEYSCANCGAAHEVVQKMSDPTLTDCPDCGQPTLRKLFNNVGVMFKGSGFYRNDSRSGANKSESSSSSASPSSTQTSSSPSTPASTPAASSTSSSSSSSN
ncbi:MAG: FmdB family zinc ribbon protein [Candidatus Nanopelagicales bacterium]